MVSGRTVLRSIDSKVDQAKSDLRSAERNLRSYQDEIKSLLMSREGFYHALAEIYLPELEADDIDRTLRELQSNALSILNEKEDRRTELREDLARLEKAREASEMELRDISSNLDTRVKEKIDLEEQVVEALDQDKSYRALEDHAEEAQKILIGNRSRVEEVRSRAAEEIPAYESNALFTYLVNRNFGEEGYRGKGIIKRLDNWVAKKVNFRENKEKYDHLKLMPTLMEERVREKESALAEVRGQMEEMEDKYSKEVGLDSVVEDCNTISQNKDQVLKRLKQLEREYSESSEELSSLDNKRGSYYARAIERIRSYLEGEGIQDLRRKANSTPDPRDDRIVDQLEDIESNLSKYDRLLESTQSEISERRRKVNGLEKIRRKFVQNNYESSRSEFPSSFDIDNLLTGYILGRMSSDNVFRKIDSDQSFRPSQTYHSRSYGSSSSSSFGGFSSGGGFGGGFSSGGGFGGGGGGFSSGGGF